MNILNFLIPPILGGIIALSTNWLAIKMLFRPHKAKYIFGIRIPFTPGLIPKERAQLTEKIAESISTRLLTPDVLAQSLSDPTLWPLPDITIGEIMFKLGIESPHTLTGPVAERLKAASDKLLPKAIEAIVNIDESQPGLDAKLAELTYKVIDENVGTFAKLFISKEKIYASIKNNVFAYLTNPQNYDFITEKLHNTIDAILSGDAVHEAITEKLYAINIKDTLTAFLTKEKHTVARVLEMAASYIAQNMPIQDMIEKKLNAFEIAEAEELILEVVGRELRLIILLGGVLGLIIGGLTLIF
ncbi:MAG: DUF445 family protein [Firmicutes bacterium]|nr:DUF445 family protein [Bacillota bacterium]